MKDRPRPKILLVDDEIEARKALSLLLEAMHFQVTVAADAEAALKFYREGQYDCVVTDYSLPGMNGDQLARLIKTANPNQRVIMVSGYCETIRINGRRPSFLDAMLAKPCKRVELESAIGLKSAAGD